MQNLIPLGKQHYEAIAKPFEIRLQAGPPAEQATSNDSPQMTPLMTKVNVEKSSQTFPARLSQTGTKSSRLSKGAQEPVAKFLPSACSTSQKDLSAQHPSLISKMAVCQLGENVLFDCLSTFRSLFLCLFPRTFRSHLWAGSWATRLIGYCSLERLFGSTKQRPLLLPRRSVLHNQEPHFDSTFAQAPQCPIMWTPKGRSETVTSGSGLAVEPHFCVLDSHGCRIESLVTSNTTIPFSTWLQARLPNRQLQVTVPRLRH
jgi:hypothetical protein